MRRVGLRAVGSGGSGSSSESLVNKVASGADTGWVFGYAMTVNGLDNTQFDMAKGVGQVADHSISPSECAEIASGPYTGEDHLGVGPFTLIAVDPSNPPVLIKLSRLQTRQENRTLIIVGIVVHTLSAVIEGFAYTTNMVTNVAAALLDLADSLGPLNRFGGNVYGPFGATLKLTRTAGEVFELAANRVVDPLSPNVTLSVDALLGTITPLFQHQDGSGGFTIGPLAGGNIDPNFFDDNGTLTVVPPNRFQIIRLEFVVSSNNTVASYGQVTYGSMATAESSIGDTVKLNPELERTGVLRAHLIVRVGTTELDDPSDAKFVEFTFGGP